jgi:hypothetical protein
MQTTVQSTSNAALWGGRIMSGLVIAFMLLDGGMKLVPLDAVILTSKQMGIPGDLARPLRVIGLVCTLLYAVPRTPVVGDILLTGYLGGRDRKPSQTWRSDFHAHLVRALSRLCWSGVGSTFVIVGYAP